MRKRDGVAFPPAAGKAAKSAGVRIRKTVLFDCAQSRATLRIANPFCISPSCWITPDEKPAFVDTAKAPRMAAISMAKRLCYERDETLGKKIGYTIRFDDFTSSDT